MVRLASAVARTIFSRASCSGAEQTPARTGVISGPRRKPPTPPCRDTARLAAVTDTAGYTLDKVVADIRGAARRSAETLKTLSDEALAVEATSMNPRFGVKPASFVVEQLLVYHLAKHQGQIRRNISQFNDARAAERS